MNENKILRGEIYYVASSETSAPVGCEIWSDRPALIVSNDTTNATAGAFGIVYLSTSMKKRPSPLHVQVTSGSRKAIAMCGQIHTVDRSRIKQKIGEATPEEMKIIDKTLCFSLGIEAESYRSLFKKWENYIHLYHIPVVEEIESMAASSVNQIIETLQRQIDILRRERDGYKNLAEAREAKLDAINASKLQL